MKILESTPARYDKGIRILTGGRLDEAYDRLTSNIKEGQEVLDVGCGTGALTLRAARKGARVKGIDVNPQMLEIAKKRIAEAGLDGKVTLHELGIAELGNENSQSYDVVMSGLCFSELSEDELIYTLKEAMRLLKPGGQLLIADEVTPDNPVMRAVNSILRLPLKIITYLITQTTTSAVKKLPERVRDAGFAVESVRLNRTQSFMELVGRKTHEPRR